MLSTNRVALLVLLVLFVGSAPALADSVYFDGTFNLANYSMVTYKSDPAVSITISQILSGGNPGAAAQIVTVLPANETIFTMEGLVNTSFAYDPSTQGAIQSISASGDKLFSSSPQFNLTSNFFRPLIFQDGNYYLGAITIPNTQDQYLTGSASGLVATDFILFDFNTGLFGAQNPNFSGDPMQFGVANRISISPSVADTTASTQDYDNLSITVATPEPGTLLLLGSSLFVLGWRKRKLLRA